MSLRSHMENDIDIAMPAEYFKDTLRPQVCSLFEEDALKDTTITLRASRITMNSFILCLVSPVLRTMVCGGFRESIFKEISLDDVDVERLLKLLGLACGKEGLVAEGIEELLSLGELAERLQMTAVRIELEDKLFNELTVDNCLEMIQRSEASGLEFLRKGCYEMLRDKFEVISQKEGFLKLSEETVGALLEEDELGASREEDVFEALMRWMSDSDEGLRGVGLLRKIRYGVMNQEYLAATVSSESHAIVNLFVGEEIATKGGAGGVWKIHEYRPGHMWTASRPGHGILKKFVSEAMAKNGGAGSHWRFTVGFIAGHLSSDFPPPDRLYKQIQHFISAQRAEKHFMSRQRAEFLPGISPRGYEMLDLFGEVLKVKMGIHDYVAGGGGGEQIIHLSSARHMSSKSLPEHILMKELMGETMAEEDPSDDARPMEKMLNLLRMVDNVRELAPREKLAGHEIESLVVAYPMPKKGGAGGEEIDDYRAGHMSSESLPRHEVLNLLVREAMTKKGGAGERLWDGVERLCGKWMVVREMKGRIIGADMLKRPRYVVLDGQGRIVVSDQELHEIIIFNHDGSVARRFGSRGEAPGQFNEPIGAAVDQQGHVVVADDGNVHIQVLDADGTTARCFGSQDTAAGREMEIMVVAYLMPKKGGAGGEEISESLPRHEVLNLLVREAMAKKGGAGEKLWDGVERLCGKWMVVRGMKGRIIGADMLKRPRYVALDGQGRIVVSDQELHEIIIFNHDGSVARRFGSRGEAPGQFNEPNGVAVDQQGHVVVADDGNGRIQVLNADGTMARCFGTQGTAVGQLKRPYGVAIDSEGHIVVADYGNHRIQMFNLDGAVVRHFGSRGAAIGQLNGPTGVAIDGGGRIVVVEFYNHRVQVFNRDGSVALCFGSEGDGPGQLRYPLDVAVDSAGRFVVTDSCNNRVQVFDLNGAVVRVMGSGRTGMGELSYPCGVVVDGADRILVTEGGDDHRVQVL